MHMYIRCASSLRPHQQNLSESYAYYIFKTLCLFEFCPTALSSHLLLSKRRPSYMDLISGLEIRKNLMVGAPTSETEKLHFHVYSTIIYDVWCCAYPSSVGHCFKLQ